MHTAKEQTNISILGIPFFSGSRSALLEALTFRMTHLTFAKPAIVFTPNPEQVMLARSHPRFAEALRSSAYNLPDGTGIVWASRALGTQPPIRNRLAGREVFAQLLRIAHQKRQAVLLIGGQGDTAQRLAAKLKRQYRGLRIVGIEGARRVMQMTARERRVLRETLDQYRPAAVFVAFGAPHQELWTLKMSKAFADVGVGVAMVVGGAFEMMLGHVATAPGWVSRAGFEWLWRLVHQPWRWRRQLALVQFVWLVLKTRFWSVVKPKERTDL